MQTSFVQFLSQGSAAVARKVRPNRHAGLISALATISKPMSVPVDAPCPVRSGPHARRDNPSRSRRAIDQFVLVSCPHHAAAGAARHREKAAGFPPVSGACQ